MTTLLAIILLGGAILVLVWAMSGARDAVPAGADGDSVNVHANELSRSGFDRVLMPVLTQMGRGIARLLPPGRIQALRHRIVLAGKQHTWNVEKAMALKAFGLAAGGTAAFLLFTAKPSFKTLVAAILLVLCGYFSVEYFLDKQAGKRQMEIQQALPDMLDQITVCVEAGLGFDASLNKVVSTNDNVLADELGRTLQDIRLGVPRTKALHQLLDRTDVQDLRLFVRALIQAERSGIPIARVLSVQSDEVREKRRQAAEERAMKLPVMLIMPLVLCILPSLFTVIMGPAVLRMVREGAV